MLVNYKSNAPYAIVLILVLETCQEEGNYTQFYVLLNCVHSHPKGMHTFLFLGKFQIKRALESFPQEPLFHNPGLGARP